MRLKAALLIAIVALVAVPIAAMAGWSQTGGSATFAKAHSLSGGNTPSASVSNRSVTVSWTATGGSVPVSGYQVKRYNTSGGLQTIGSNCSGTIAGTSCTENSVPGGDWRYSVTPVRNNWTGAESSQSTAVTVASPNLTLSPRILTSLPSTLSGSIASFIPGQTVTYRLDNPTTGTVLTGSISPTPVQSSGSATASVTIPSGTTNGTHTVYAIGSAGDTASTTINVSIGGSDSTSDWNLKDASAGAGEVDASDPLSFASDNLYDTSSNFSGTFSTSRYLQFDMNGSLPSGTAPSSTSFNFNFSANQAGDTACFYFEVYRKSTSTLIGTHGSSSSTIACQTGLTFNATSTSLPEVTSTTIANDLRIKVYGSVTGNRPMRVDMATVSTTISGQSYTLYEPTFADAADGSASTFPWSLAAAGDGVYYQAAANWPATATTSKYLKFSLPAYVPNGSNINSVTFKHSYVQNGGGSTCFYYEAFDGTTSLGTYGSASTPYSCNASSSVYVTDSITMPEVNTAAAANNLIIKAYGTNSGSHTSRSDLAQLDVNYTQGTPGMSLASGTITSLPATKTGQIQNFASGQTVTFRLDNPDSGTVLSGTISPDPVPAGGTSSVSVTIPTGVSNGTHTVYAIGSAGDIASASITVDRSVSVTTSDWSLIDASTGTASDQSDGVGFANDGRFATSSNFSTTFSGGYLAWDYNNVIPASSTPSAANFNFNFSANTAGDQVCFYFLVYRFSTAQIIGTHGSAASPIACQTGTTFNATSTSLPEITSAAIANDIAVIVYGTNSGSRPMNVDLATVSVTSSGQNYTLFEDTLYDAADGSSATIPWSLDASGDGFAYQAGNWTTAFASSRFLQFSFPAYVPTTASLDGVTFSHSYVQSGGGSTCFYYEVYNGTTLLGTHGSSGSPYSCNASSSVYVTDSISLPEVTTAAAANNLVVKAYGRNSSSRSNMTDLVQLQLTYTPN